MLSLDDVRDAAARLDGVAHRTPCCARAPSTGWSARRCTSRPECFQRGGAFKFRGAYSLISTLDAAQRAAGVVAFSSGNHAQAVALAVAAAGRPRGDRHAPGRSGAEARRHPRLRRRGGALRPLRGRPRRDRARPGGRAGRRARPAVRPPAGDGRPGHRRAGAAGRGGAAGCAARAGRRRRPGRRLRHRRRGARSGHPGDRRRARGGRRHAPVAGGGPPGRDPACRGRSPTASRSRRPAS